MMLSGIGCYGAKETWSKVRLMGQLATSKIEQWTQVLLRDAEIFSCVSISYCNKKNPLTTKSL